MLLKNNIKNSEDHNATVSSTIFLNSDDLILEVF